MSSSDPTSAIFLTDTPAQIKNKINKYAFSGGQDTKELQREKGANLEVDIAYNYLTYLLEDDEKLADIGQKYKTGQLLTSEVKEILVTEVQRIIKEHQDIRSKITDEEVKEWMTPRSLKLFNDGVIPGDADKKDKDGAQKEPKQKAPKEKGEGKKEKAKGEGKKAHEGTHAPEGEAKKEESKPEDSAKQQPEAPAQ